jgi:hypothetical protein
MKRGRAKTKTGTRIAAVLVGRDVLELAPNFQLIKMFLNLPLGDVVAVATVVLGCHRSGLQARPVPTTPCPHRVPAFVRRNISA